VEEKKMRKITKTYRIIVLLCLVHLVAVTDLAGFEGFGASTLGGDCDNPDTVPVTVTSLADPSDPDSTQTTLRQALSGGDDLCVVFNVGGTITLQNPLIIDSQARITIDGATAPFPGITLAGNGLIIRNSQDVIVQHLRVRNSVKDGIAVQRGSSNVVIDHCSATDSTDEDISITYSVEDVTVSWCLIGQTQPITVIAPETPRNKGMILAPNKGNAVTNVSLHHNLFVNNFQRSPLFKSPGLIDIYNNIMANWGSYAIQLENGAFGNIVNNVFTTAFNADDAVKPRGTAGAFFIQGNQGPGNMDVNTQSTSAMPFDVDYRMADEVDAVDEVELMVRQGAGALPHDLIDGGLAGYDEYPTDLYMLIDLSGTSFDDLKAEALATIEMLKASNTNTRFGLGFFEDYPIPPFGCDGDVAYQRLIDLTFDDNAVLSEIEALAPQECSDADAAGSQLAALYQAATGSGQDLSEEGFPEASIDSGMQANFRDGEVEPVKLLLLLTDTPFHNSGDVGHLEDEDVIYPGPTLDETVEAIMALDPPQVVGTEPVAQIAADTGALAPAGGVDCDADGMVDIPEGEPLVCPPGQGAGGAAVAESAVKGAITIPIDLDVKPKNPRNPINPRSKGITRVALLGSDIFDVTQVHRLKLEFGPAGALPVHDLSDPDIFARHLRDVNKDGQADLLVHFRTRDTGIACGDTSVALVGKTLQAQIIEGSDAIKTVGCKHKHR
jgi:pectate lyase